MIVNERLLSERLAPHVLEEATKQLGHVVVYEHQADIMRAVDKLLMDGEWLKPIVENEMRNCVRQFALSLWTSEERAAQREWFDLFAEKLLQNEQKGDPNYTPKDRR